MTDIDTASIRTLAEQQYAVGGDPQVLAEATFDLLDALAAANATIERVREVRDNLSWMPHPERSAPDVVVGVDDLDAALSDAPVSDAARPAPSVEITDEMVEAGARAAMEADTSNGDTWDDAPVVEWERNTYRTIARAALTAALSPRVESTPDENGGE